MTKNLVIVESPAKARTIERYLGDDYKVLASYGHVRDLPENPGKGKFGVDVEHDFEPEYVINEDRRKQLNAITKAAGSLRPGLPRHRPRPRGRGHRLARRRGGRDPRRQDPARDLQRDHQERHHRTPSRDPRDIDMGLVDAQQTRRIMDRLVGYTLSPLISRKVRSGLSAGRVQSVAVRLVVEREREIEAFTAREYWTLRGPARDGRRRALQGRPGQGRRHACGPGWRGQEERDPHPRRGHGPGLRRGAAWRDGHRHLGQGAQPASATRRRRSPPAPCSRRPAASSATAPSARCRWPSACTRASRSTASPRASSPTCEPTRSTWPSRPGARRTTSSAGATAVDYAVEGGAATRPRPRAPRRRTRRSGRPASRAIPSRCADASRTTSCGCTASSGSARWPRRWRQSRWRPPTAELEAGRFGLRASATRTIFDGFTKVYTEGRDDGEDDEEEARLPALAEGDRSDVRDVEGEQHFTEPPPRFTEATLIKALEEHGIGRPSTYAATISTIQDRGYVKVVDKRLRPEIVADIVTDVLVEHFGDYVDYDFTARMEEELDEVAAGERAWVPLLHEFYDPLHDAGRREAQDAQAQRPHDRGDRRGLLGGSPHGHPPRAQRPLPGLLDVPRPQGDARHPRRGAGHAAGRGRRRDLPQVRRGHARRPSAAASARSRAAHRYPDCDYIHRTGPPPPPPLPFEVECPKCGEGHADRPSRAAHRQRLLRLRSLSQVRLHHQLRAARRASTTPTPARSALKDESGICLRCGAPVDLPGDRAELPGQKLPGGEPDPAALAPSRKRRPAAKGAQVGRQAHEAQDHQGHGRRRSRRRRQLMAERVGQGAMMSRGSGPRRSLGRRAFMASLDARDASPAHQARLRTARRAVPRLARRRSTAWTGHARRAARCAPTSPSSMAAASRARPSAAASPRCARSTASAAARAGSRAIPGPPSSRRAARRGCRA